MAFGKLVFVEVGNRNGNVLFLAAGVGKAEVNETDFVVLDHLDYVGDCHFNLLDRAIKQKTDTKNKQEACHVKIGNFLFSHRRL